MAIQPPSTFPSIAALHAARKYPDPLKAVFGQPLLGGVFPALDIVTQCQFSPPLNNKAYGLDVTWFGFRQGYPGKSRLPDFYACELTDAQGRTAAGANVEIDLYEIGAVGNNFDVDILVTDSNGGVVSAPKVPPPGLCLPGLYIQPHGGAKTGVGLTDLGFYEAAKATWTRPPLGVPPYCSNRMTFEFRTAQAGSAIPSPCILWVVSYRHEPTKNRPGSLAYATAGGGGGATLNQDDDGSPGDPEPGGECP